MQSTSVVFPWSTCAMIAMFRRALAMRILPACAYEFAEQISISQMLA
jgi:hypothetical protein